MIPLSFPKSHGSSQLINRICGEPISGRDMAFKKKIN